MSETVILIATAIAKPGREEELGQAMQALLAPTRAEPGCIAYTLHRSTENRATWMMYEIWRSREDLKTHGQAPHLVTFKGQLADLLAEPLSLRFFEKVG